jgi:molecular chaperone HscC
MIVGIDLGTTNSLVGVWRNGQATLIPNALGQLLTPSAVSVGDDGALLVGMAARERLSTDPSKTAAAFKRHMGTDRTFMLGSRAYRAEELSAMVLRSLKDDAEAFLGVPVQEAVITVPAYFNDAQRKATKAAGELAGFKVERLLAEPTAAALAYELGAKEGEYTALIADLGGGTFDVSLLHVFDRVVEVRATAGDSWLGGENFVDAIVSAFMDEAGRKAGVPEVSDIAPIHGALRRQAELAKRRLSEAEEATLQLAYDGRKIEWRLTRDSFERIAETELARARTPIERALRDARVDPATLSHVILVGGASRMPMFRRLIGRLFKRLPMQQLNPEEAVARGAAVRAGMLMRDIDLKELIMTDVAPFTLGIEISERDGSGVRVDDVYLPIIERNTVIPASRSKRVTTLFDNQSLIELKIHQGESRIASENILLGRLETKIVPAAAGKERVDVRFSYDPSGILEVESTVLSTGIKESLVIEGNPGVLSAEEIAGKVAEFAKLKIHPRDEADNQAAIARAKRLYEERLGPAREAIGRALTSFLAALKSEDPDRVRSARAVLDRIVAGHDDGPFL